MALALALALALVLVLALVLTLVAAVKAVPRSSALLNFVECIVPWTAGGEGRLSCVRGTCDDDDDDDACACACVGVCARRLSTL